MNKVVCPQDAIKDKNIMNLFPSPLFPFPLERKKGGRLIIQSAAFLYLKLISHPVSLYAKAEG